MTDTPLQDRFSRIDQMVDTHRLCTSSFTGVGAGRMGSPVFSQLVRHGVATRLPGRMRIIDSDHIEKHNLIGTDYRQCHIGRGKAEVTAEILREIDEHVNVSYWNQHLQHIHVETVKDMARQSDLLGLFADDVELMLELAHECHSICPIIIAWLGSQADFAEIGLSIPGQTPSLAKTMGKRKRQAIHGAQALGCDTAFVANFVAALCLSLLTGGKQGQHILPVYANAPLFLVGLRRRWIFENQPDDVVRSILCVASPDGH